MAREPLKLPARRVQGGNVESLCPKNDGPIFCQKPDIPGESATIAAAKNDSGQTFLTGGRQSTKVNLVNHMWQLSRSQVVRGEQVAQKQTAIQQRSRGVPA